MLRQIHEYHPVIGHTFVPGIAARVPHEGGGYLVEANQAGFRCGHEVTKDKPAGRRRVLLFGDSFTAGDGVSNKQRFGDLIERRYPDLQVLNFGLSGTGTDQQYLIFREFAADLEYDLLVVCPLVENIRRVASRYRQVLARDGGKAGYSAKPYYVLVDGELVLRHVPVPKGIRDRSAVPPEELPYLDDGGPHAVLRGLVNTYLGPLKTAIQSWSGYQPVPEYDDPSHPAWILMKAILSRWFSECAGHAVLICPIPLYHHVEELSPAESYGARFRELAEATGVTVCDPLPRFRQESPAGRRKCRFDSDPHLTPYGHEVLADALGPVIAERADWA